MKKNSLMKMILATTLTAGGTFMMTPQSVDAETTQSQEKLGDIVKLNESTMQFNVAKDNSIKVDENGNAQLVSKNGNEKLPSEAVDKDGKRVELIYLPNENGALIQVKLKDPQSSNIAERSLSKSVKCYLGTVGGAIGGGLGGAAAAC